MEDLLDAVAGEKQTKKARETAGGKKITPSALYKKLMTFAKVYQLENEEDFREAARIYAEEAALIGKMRDILEDEGLTVYKTYKTGDQLCAHPLLAELPRHVDSANKCLATIDSMITKRGAKTEHAARALDAFRLHP